MTDKIRHKLAKIYALIERGTTEGEKAAARAALDRIIDAYGIEDLKLDELTKREFTFTYVTAMEFQLLFRLAKRLTGFNSPPRKPYGKKSLRFSLDYLEGVTLECAYEYFRRHMKAEWIRTCAPLVKRCRTPKGANKRRKALQEAFMNRYLIASNLVDEEEIETVPIKSQAELDRLRTVQGVQGGKFHKQADSGRYLQ